MDILAILNRVEEELVKRGKTKSEMYKSCEITASAVSQWRHGATAPTHKKLQAIADFLSISYEYLVTGMETKQSAAPIGALTDAQLKFALWGDTDVIDDADLEDVRRYAAFIKARKEQK